jgi:ribulose-phosphate 3-epimerase
MDNVFVNNFTFGHPVVKCLRNSLRSKYNLEPEFDMHMMVQEPRKLISPMAEAGGNIYTFHYETTKTHEECKELFRLIRESGMKVGLAIKPETPVEHILPLVPLTDVILVMTVNPGFGSQSFMEDMMPKVSLLRKTFPELDIGVDGGVGPKTIESVAEAGANMIVSGSALTNLGVDAKAVMQDMKDILRRRLSGNN